MAKVIARLLVTAHADDLIFLGLLEALDRSFATTAAAFDAAASFTRDVDEHWRAHREPRPEWTRWCRERGLVAAKQTWRSER
jgi:hypothetical protein